MEDYFGLKLKHVGTPLFRRFRFDRHYQEAPAVVEV